MIRYTDVTRRLCKMRIEKNITQSEMASMLGISQGQYSDVENGKLRLSYEALVSLHGNGWNIDHLLTGKDGICPQTEVEKLSNCVESKNWLPYGVWWILQSTAEQVHVKDPDIRFELQLLHKMLEQDEDKTVLEAARFMLKNSQNRMTDLLGVCIKTYRDFEKGYKFPDGEILLLLYNVSHCRPSLFMGFGNERWNIVSYALSNLTPKQQIMVKNKIQYDVEYLGKIKDE